MIVRFVLGLFVASFLLIGSSASVMAQSRQPFRVEVGKEIPTKMQAYLDKNWQWRWNEGNNRCLFEQFDVQYQVNKLRGPCAVSSQEVESLQAGAPLRFTITAQSNGIEYANSTLDMICQRNDDYWASRHIVAGTSGRGMLCQIGKLSLPDGKELVAARGKWGFYLIRINDDGLFYPMGALQKDFQWLDMEKVRGGKYYPATFSKIRVLGR